MKKRVLADKLFNDLRVVGNELTLATDKQVSEAEGELGTIFPSGYREYVTRLGDGKYADALKVLMPGEVSSNLKAYRELVEEYWSWDEGPVVLIKDQAINSIEVGFSDYGDMLIFHPGNTDQMFVLPRDTEQILAVGSNLAEALEWMRQSQILGLDAGERMFKSAKAIEAELEAEKQEVLRLGREAAESLASQGKKPKEGPSFVIVAEAGLPDRDE